MYKTAKLENFKCQLNLENQFLVLLRDTQKAKDSPQKDSKKLENQYTPTLENKFGVLERFPGMATTMYLGFLNKKFKGNFSITLKYKARSQSI